MTEPINIQLNVLQSQDIPRQAQANKDVSNHQQMGQEMNRVADSKSEQETVQVSPDAQQTSLSKDGSGRGRAFQRQRKRASGEAASAPEIERVADPGKGLKVDFTR